MMIERFETNSFCLKEKTVGGITPDDPEQEKKSGEIKSFQTYCELGYRAKSTKTRLSLSRPLNHITKTLLILKLITS